MRFLWVILVHFLYRNKFETIETGAQFKILYNKHQKGFFQTKIIKSSNSKSDTKFGKGDLRLHKYFSYMRFYPKFPLNVNVSFFTLISVLLLS